jgi:hypothetical protein
MSNNTLYFIKENAVYLNANKWFEERLIGELKEANQQYTIASMEERFKELEEKVAEITKEFNESADKVRIAGKVSRTRNYLCHAKAIGDYTTLFEQLDSFEGEIKKAVEQNLIEKENLCKEAEAILEAKDFKEGAEKLRELQKKYKELAPVPDLKNEELRDRFEKAKDEFFKLKQGRHEAFEQELLDNLSKKIELCEQAEKLSNSTEWKKTTEVYQEMNEEWKKIGMVPKHRMEELWFRFNTAKDIFFNNKREHFGDIKTEQEENLVKKLALIEKAEAIKESKDWKKTTDEYNLLMEEWKKIGRVPAEKSDEVWNQFLAAKNHFYTNKDGHYGNIRVQLEDNYAKKMAIVNHAESLQNTMDFDTATQEYLDMFEEWKKIGRIPKEYGDEPWDRFQKAKKNFFDRKDANRELRKKEVSKDLHERITRNRSFLSKLNREIQREEDLLFDMDDRLKNLPATLRSYEKREEYLEMIEEIKDKINELKEKSKDVRNKLQQDEREMNHVLRGPRPKKPTDASNDTKPAVSEVESAPHEIAATAAQEPVAAPVADEVVMDNVSAATAEPIEALQTEQPSEIAETPTEPSNEA